MIGFGACLLSLIDAPNLYTYRSTPWATGLLLGLVITAIPPALPATITAGVVFAMKWLKKKEIFCIDLNRINVAGWISIMVFDKTGTLTEEGLSIYGF